MEEMRSFFIEDYSGIYYETLLKVSVPETVEGKFVQLDNGEHGYFVFAPFELSKYHANIVERFCITRNRGLVFVYNDKKDDGYITSHDWEIRGGGRWLRSEKRLKLYGSSEAFGKYEWNREIEKALIDAGSYDSVFSC